MAESLDGPFVGLAVLCQGLDRKPDGSLDVLGIVEGVMLEPRADLEVDPLGLRPVAVLPLRLAVSLRAGAVRGRHAVRVVGRYPAGNAGPAVGLDVEFSDERPVATINVPIELQVHEAGTYQFDVCFDGAVVTRVPLQVIFQA